jgi:hypothetical protein
MSFHDLLLRAAEGLTGAADDEERHRLGTS